MSLTYDQARQFGKLYAGALNSGLEHYSALFAPGAQITAGGEPATLERIRELFPAERSGYRGARLDPPELVFTIRLRDRAAARVEDFEHRVEVDGDGRITRLAASV